MNTFIVESWEGSHTTVHVWGLAPAHHRVLCKYLSVILHYKVLCELQSELQSKPSTGTSTQVPQKMTLRISDQCAWGPWSKLWLNGLLCERARLHYGSWTVLQVSMQLHSATKPKTQAEILILSHVYLPVIGSLHYYVTVSAELSKELKYT